MHHGCEYLRQALWGARPALHVFGHIHAGRGVERVTWDLSSRFVRFREERTAVIKDPTPTSKRQFLVDTVRVPRYALRRGEETLCVNASVASGSWKRGVGHPKVWNKAVVVDLEVEAVEVGVQDGVGTGAKVRVRGVGDGWNSVAVVDGVGMA